MSRATKWLIIRTIALIASIGIAYVVLQDPFKALEAHTAVALAQLLGYGDHVTFLAPSAVIVSPYTKAAFLAIVTPSCSALASALSLIVLGSVAPRTPPYRRLLATTAAIATVVLGNLLRITLALVVGVYAGRSSTVLFHDWVGSTFTFVYTLAGFMVLLGILMPSRRAPAERVEEHDVIVI